MKKNYRSNVGIMVLNKEGKVLAGKRKRWNNEKNLPDSWQMPQGGIDEGECPKETGLRELQEELAIEANEVEFIDLWNEYQYYDYSYKVTRDGIEYDGQKQKWLILRYLKDDSSIHLEDASEQEFSRFGWLTMNEIADSIWEMRKPTYKKLAERYKDILAQ